MQSVIMDSRLRDLDKRVNDAVSLAAIASRMAQRPGIFAYVIDAIQSAVSGILHGLYSLTMLPWKTLIRVYVLLFGHHRKTKSRTRRLDEKGRKSI